MPSPNDFKIDTVVVRADRRQGGKSPMMKSLRNQGIHMEAGLIEAKQQLGTPLTGVEHDLAESPSGGSQRSQLVVHL